MSNIPEQPDLFPDSTLNLDLMQIISSILDRLTIIENKLTTLPQQQSTPQISPQEQELLQLLIGKLKNL